MIDFNCFFKILILEELSLLLGSDYSFIKKSM